MTRYDLCDPLPIHRVANLAERYYADVAYGGGSKTTSLWWRLKTTTGTRLVRGLADARGARCGIHEQHRDSVVAYGGGLKTTSLWWRLTTTTGE